MSGQINQNIDTEIARYINMTQFIRGWTLDELARVGITNGN
jgi:hypothetical protein